jgi:hypothetical protein
MRPNRNQTHNPKPHILFQTAIALESEDYRSVFDIHCQQLSGISSELALPGPMLGGFVVGGCSQGWKNDSWLEQQPGDLPGRIDLEAAARLLREDAKKRNLRDEDENPRDFWGDLFPPHE